MWTAKKMNANTVQVFLILLYGFVQYQKKEKKKEKELNRHWKPSLSSS